MRTALGVKQAEEMLKKHDKGWWTRRLEPVACAADTGDSGFRETYNNGERDILCVEWPRAQYTTKAYSLIEE